jgi:hypothetical protein
MGQAIMKRRSRVARLAWIASTLATAACSGSVEGLDAAKQPDPAQCTPTAPSASTTSAPQGNDVIVDPLWERSNEYFLAPSAPSPDLQYYSANTYPLHEEDDSPAGASFTWTSTAAWNGPSTTDLSADGAASITGFVPGDTWFWTHDRADCSALGTSYWFRATVDLGAKANLTSVTLEDKYHPGRIAVNDGLIVFVDGHPQPVMPNVAGQGSPKYGAGLVRDDSETGWSFDALQVSTDALQDGRNEIAVLYDERCGEGGLGHLVLHVVSSLTARAG